MHAQPAAGLGGPGDALQAYSDDGRFGGFGEVEHHSPALQLGTPEAGWPTKPAR